MAQDLLPNNFKKHMGVKIMMLSNKNNFSEDSEDSSWDAMLFGDVHKMITSIGINFGGLL